LIAPEFKDMGIPGSECFEVVCPMHFQQRRNPYGSRIDLSEQRKSYGYLPILAFIAV
jgi:hypothetical protein